VTDQPDYTNLIERLRGIYRIPIKDGAGPLKGSMEYVRQFDGLPPINAEAASAIATLQVERDRYLAALHRLRSDMCSIKSDCPSCNYAYLIYANAANPPEKLT